MINFSIKEWLKVATIDRLDFNKKIKLNIPVLVYQMGKVGSSSIYHPLKKSYSGVVGHTHQFNQEAWYLEVRKLHEMYYKNNLPRLKIVSLIREPIGRNVSEFFHRLKQYAGIDPKKDSMSVEQLLENFLNNLDHDFALEWMDNNLKSHFGIDVYQHVFPESGYAYYENQGVEVLLMKHDILDSVKEEQIRSFLSMPDFKMEQRNIGSQKTYKNMYKAFKENVRLPHSYLNKMNSSKYFNHFYSPIYIEKVVNKWI